MIESFRDKRTAALFLGEKRVRELHPDVAKQAKLTLQALHNAVTLKDLKGAGYMLEKLEKDRRGQWGIRVTRQWRVCFRWDSGEAMDVEFCDYH
jgi:proteic killer suppression protein